MLACDRRQRVAELHAAYRARRLTVEQSPRVRWSRRAAGRVVIDANAVAGAMVTTFAHRGGRLA